MDLTLYFSVAQLTVIVRRQYSLDLLERIKKQSGQKQSLCRYRDNSIVIIKINNQLSYLTNFWSPSTIVPQINNHILTIFHDFTPNFYIFTHNYPYLTHPHKKQQHIISLIILYHINYSSNLLDRNMIDILTHTFESSATFRYLVYMIVVLIVYLIYRAIFKGMIFTITGDYEQKGKNIGRPLPAFPNGWYVALRAKELENGKSEAVDIAGQNIVVFRSLKGHVYALEAYCKHLGANLGIGGKVINDRCIQCPFHGWLYDGESGICVDYNGKPMEVQSVEYNCDLGEKGKKLNWVQKDYKTTSLRKYPVTQMNGYIYVWIHAMQQHQQKPQYPIIDFSPIMKNLEYGATTIHDIKCHIQDIPENGADIFHFKYVHSEIVHNLDAMNFLWKAKWKRGDDEDIREMFQHQKKFVRDFRQKIWKQCIENYPQKQYISVGHIDNYIKFPFLGHKFIFNGTIIQIGSSVVFVLLTSQFFTIVLCHYVQPKQKYRQKVYHDGYASKFFPYWATAFAIKMQGNQVTNDMYLWDSKKFARNPHFKKGQVADQYLKRWREWYSQHYEGCLQKQKNRLEW